MRKWYSKPPPSIGWWPASTMRNPTVLRWWNGRVWSVSCAPTYSAELAGRYARQAAIYQSAIEWTDRPKHWPERSMT